MINAVYVNGENTILNLTGGYTVTVKNHILLAVTETAVKVFDDFGVDPETIGFTENKDGKEFPSDFWEGVMSSQKVVKAFLSLNDKE